jgi:rubrerythrin
MSTMCDVLPVTHLADLEEFAQQRADTSIDEGIVRLNNRAAAGKVSSMCLRPHTDFYVEPGQSDMTSRFDAGCLITGHWQCQICGAKHLGPLPVTCEACGADRQHLERPQEIRLEMTSR